MLSGTCVLNLLDKSRQRRSDRLRIGHRIPPQLLFAIMRELAVVQLNEPDVVLRQNGTPTLVVDTALNTARTTADSHAPVHDRNGLTMLQFAIFDRYAQRWIVSIDRELSSKPVGVSAQEVKPVLAKGCEAQYLVTQIDDVVLVAHPRRGTHDDDSRLATAVIDPQSQLFERCDAQSG